MTKKPSNNQQCFHNTMATGLKINGWGATGGKNFSKRVNKSKARLFSHCQLINL